jgi:hypothetical protein
MIVLSVRSYSFCDIYISTPDRAPPCGIMSMQGQLYLFFSDFGGERRLFCYSVDDVSLIRGTFLTTNGPTFRVANNSHFIIITHWLLAALIAALAVLPWITPARRSSIRSLAIATTLVAIILAIWKTIVVQ